MVLNGGDKRLVSEKWRLWEGVVVEQVGEVGGGFELNPLWDSSGD